MQYIGQKMNINGQTVKKVFVLVNVVLIMVWGWSKHSNSFTSTNKIYFIPETAIILDESVEGMNIQYDGEALYYTINDRYAVEIPFFLHIYPMDDSVMTAEQQEIGFINQDFSLQDISEDLIASEYIAKIVLPYALDQISYIETGQYMQDGQRIWERIYFMNSLFE